MQEKREDVAVACVIAGRLFGRKQRELLHVVIFGTLVQAQAPYRDAQDVERDGWPLHFHSLQVFAEHDKRLYPLHIESNMAYEACELAAIESLRYLGELEDDDHDFAMQYG